MCLPTEMNDTSIALELFEFLKAKSITKKLSQAYTVDKTTLGSRHVIARQLSRSWSSFSIDEKNSVIYIKVYI